MLTRLLYNVSKGKSLLLLINTWIYEVHIIGVKYYELWALSANECGNQEGTIYHLVQSNQTAPFIHAV